MKIIIIGSTGQLGSELIQQSRQRQIDHIGLDYPQLDLIDDGSLKTTLTSAAPDLIVNASAYTAVDRAESQPDLAFAINSDGPASLADFCKQRHIPLIHISTDYVFDGRKKRAYTEKDPISPLGVYGQSKAAGEENVRTILERAIIIRTAWLYGVNGQNFVKTMLRLGQKNTTVRVVNDQYGCPTYAADLADAILQMVHQIQSHKKVIWGTYHFCGQGSTTWYHFARHIFNLAKIHTSLTVKQVLPVQTSEYPTPAKRPCNSVLDCTKIKKNFNIRIQPWEVSLEKMLDRLYHNTSRPISE